MSLTCHQHGRCPSVRGEALSTLLSRWPCGGALSVSVVRRVSTLCSGVVSRLLALARLLLVSCDSLGSCVFIIRLCAVLVLTTLDNFITVFQVLSRAIKLRVVLVLS